MSTVARPDSTPLKATAAVPVQCLSSGTVVPEDFAKDAMISWFRGEFAVANAMIDALLSHLAPLGGGGSDYDAVFAAVHRRRRDWIPVLQMQEYFPVAEVAAALRKITAKKIQREEYKKSDEEREKMMDHETCHDEDTIKSDIKENGVGDDRMKSDIKENGVHDDSIESNIQENSVVDNSVECDIVKNGVDGSGSGSDYVSLCSKHEVRQSRPQQITLRKVFTAKEQVKGHMINVLKGLKLYENVFTGSELSDLTDFATELRVAGQNGNLGNSYVLFNTHGKANRREMIHVGVPMFQEIRNDVTGSSQSAIQSIPVLLQGVIDHLVQWGLLPKCRRPNSIIINFLDEGEHSQPFIKPPHVEQPISTLLLCESTMGFGHMLPIDCQGNYRAQVVLPLKKGSLLVMRGNNEDMAKHVICPSPTKRISINFFHVLSVPRLPLLTTATATSTAIEPCQSGMPSPYVGQYGVTNRYMAIEMRKWGVIPPPVVILPPLCPVISSPTRLNCSGTGVFLPSTMESKKPSTYDSAPSNKDTF